MNEIIDGCKHCTVRGNFKACRTVDGGCQYHETWYAHQMEKKLQEASDLIQLLAGFVGLVDFNECHSKATAMKKTKEFINSIT